MRVVHVLVENAAGANVVWNRTKFHDEFAAIEPPIR